MSVGKQLKKIFIVGNPNVGKSVLFTALTGKYATASNYPGTTVEVLRGAVSIFGESFEVVDTPGMYSIFPVTEEERVARSMLFAEVPDMVVHVADAKNLDRMLPLTFQLMDTGLPVILALNIMDEAEKDGIFIDIPALEQSLGIPVVGAAFARKIGLDDLKSRISSYALPAMPYGREYPAAIENAISRVLPGIPADFHPGISRRAIALLLLSGDSCLAEELTKHSPPNAAAIAENAGLLAAANPAEPVSYCIAVAQRGQAMDVFSRVVHISETKINFKARLANMMINPLTGFPLLLLILYFGLYKFVGGFGAGTLVDFIEGHLFESHLNPFFEESFTMLVPWPEFRGLFVGDYGILTMGLRYAFAIILPIVALFFLVFAIIEDSGYLPRLAMLIDNIFKKVGLSGRAVIPMVLGFGCATMATLVTRTLPTKKERILATMLLALAVPCSAQLGVMLALFEGKPKAAAVWLFVLVGVFLAVGKLGARLVPGSPASFFMELPPLRLPHPGNVLTKTFVRVKWYLKEIVPVFLAASSLIWLAQVTGIMNVVERAMAATVKLAGLPAESARVFLFGFLRRDYGAAGLYDLQKSGMLTNGQMTVACVALTLFLPCIAQFLVNIRERGWRTGLAISAITIVVSFGVAVTLNALLTTTGIRL